LTASGGNPVTYAWTDQGSNTQQLTVTNSMLYGSTAFACASPVKDWTGTNPLGSYMSQVAYANGTSLGITYEQTPGMDSTHTTGRVTGITLPTGGTVSFTYPGSFQCLYLEPTTMKRTTSDGTWTYTWAGLTGGNTTTVVSPAGNTTVYTFNSCNGNDGSCAVQAPFLVSKVTKQGSSTVLNTQTFCYNAASNCNTAFVHFPVTQIDSYDQPSGVTTTNHTKKTFDSVGNLLTTSVYDFGSTTAGFTTYYSYGTWNGTGCSAIGNYVVKVCDSVTKDAAGNIVSETRGSYDAKGNLLTSYVRNSPTTFLTASTGYTSTGALGSHTSETGVASSFLYGSCNGGFPTQSTVGGIVTYDAWNCDGGVRTSHTDANGLITTFGYANAGGTADPLWRLSSVTTPLQDTAYTIYGTNTVENTFSFDTVSGTVTKDTIETVDGYGRPIRTQTKRGSSYDTVTTVYNVVAGTVKTSIPCAVPLGSDCTTGFTTATIDGAGRTSSAVDGGGAIVSNVFAGSSTEARVTSTLSPAPAGENNKAGIRSIDGLGRVTSNCGVLVSGGSACGHGSSSNGILTAYSYTTGNGTSTTTATRGSETRTTIMDSLGRVTSETNPESGTDVYTYDSYAPGTCGGWTSEPGELMLVAHANGTSICYVYYDGLHRLMRTGDGGAVTHHCSSFAYDSITSVTVGGETVQPVPSGYAASNIVGRLVEAETDDCSAWPPTTASMITDEWFSYDGNGNLSDVWEHTPHSGGYYHTSVTRAHNNAVTAVSGIPGYATTTYGLDSDGHPSTAMQGTTTLVAGVTYGPTGPTYVNIGSGTDEDVYSYDPSTGRMSQYQFYVGSSNTKGVLNWSANGTLGSLAITDGFNAGGTQTCTFAYDDVSRLTGDSCTNSGWNQTFSYDQYDNLTKSGNSAWNPGYNTKNQFSGIGATYDLSGNTTYDTFSHYRWDAYNKMSSSGGSTVTCGTSGTCFTYDALGRVVEKSVNAAYSEILYSPLGKTAVMSGQSVTMSYLPLPGGGTLYSTGATGTNRFYQHKDWLGTARVQSNISARTVTYDRAFAPYGETYANFGSTINQNFTGDTQDLFTGLFDTPNRELNPGQGRWPSPDPAGAGWNAYAYGTNPNTQTDPTGLAIYGGGLFKGITGYVSDSGENWNEFGGSFSPVPADASSDQSATSSGTGGDCSQGCVTTTAINTLVIDGQKTLVGTVGPVDLTSISVADAMAAYFQARGATIPSPVHLNFGVSTSVQSGVMQVDSNGQASVVVPPAVGGAINVGVNGPTDDQQVLAESSVGVGKFISIGTDLVMDNAGNIYFQGAFVSLGASWPPSPASVSTPLNNFAPSNGGINIWPIGQECGAACMF
jgi:RHS repeat-associated protein